LATFLLSGAAAQPPAGGLQSLPELRSEAVRLANPGYEDGTAGWLSAPEGPFQVARSGARSGTACLRFDAAVPSKYTPSVRQALKTIGPGVYKLRSRRGGRYETRMGFMLAGDVNHPRATGQRGASVTDLRWRGLGRAWLGEKGGFLTLDHDALLSRLKAEALYLTVGLSRNWRGEYWPLVVGVHVVPDYEIGIDYDKL